MYIKLIQPLTHMRPMDTHIKTRMSPHLGLNTIANMFQDEHEVVGEKSCQNISCSNSQSRELEECC